MHRYYGYYGWPCGPAHNGLIDKAIDLWLSTAVAVAAVSFGGTLILGLVAAALSR